MKTISKASKIQRVDDETAEMRVRHQGWVYVSKSLWKKQIKNGYIPEDKTEIPEETISGKQLKKEKNNKIKV